MDAATQQALLKDPLVQETMRKHGEEALRNPEVQAQVLKVCKEKFPQYAGMAASEVRNWANDPAVQAQAKEYAGIGLAYLADAGAEIMNEIEQGPSGVRILSFFVSVASAALGILCLVDIFSSIGHPILYLISVYQFIFALTTCLFEAPPERIEQLEAKTGIQISTYQDKMIKHAGFLTILLGRGLFYIFQGSMWLVFASLLSISGIFKIAVGLSLCFIGILHLLMAKGIMPHAVVSKIRHTYRGVPTNNQA
eukprot:TRINITY_DN24008_c0_g1_i1.p1 TRINITY_DN24008_c0_g1~~TRINITY_DN24008_c0_g1_i1.p1  ORF type:complete len:252 (-),score=40.37 TRINITY_DN24008_c0_g1_i1:38-793(-)